MEEKYIALFQNIEVFNDYKRTCYPPITPVANPSFGGVVPGRLFYAQSETNVNPNAPSVAQQLATTGFPERQRPKPLPLSRRDSQGEVPSTQVALILAVLVAGCYNYHPLENPSPASGTRVAADLTDAGSLQLASQTGPGITRVRGEVIDSKPDALFLALRSVLGRNEQETFWSGEQVRFLWSPSPESSNGDSRWGKPLCSAGPSQAACLRPSRPLRVVAGEGLAVGRVSRASQATNP